MIARERRLQRGDRSIAPHAEPGGVDLVAVAGGGEEVLAPRLHPLHRPAEPAGHGRYQYFLGIDVALDAEAAADVGRDDADRSSGISSAAATAVRTLNGTCVDDHTVSRPLSASVVASTARPSIGTPGDTGVDELDLHHRLGLGEAARDVTRAGLLTAGRLSRQPSCTSAGAGTTGAAATGSGS